MQFDVAVIGAGPIGIEMNALLSRAGASVLHLEAGAIGETITRWPRHTRFFSSPEWIAICGIPIQTPGQEIITGEEYLAYLRHVVETLQLAVRTYERVEAIAGGVGDFALTTVDHFGRRRAYRARTIVLATGDMNAPHVLGIPGEELPHVTHLWSDPHRYFQRDLLIVGGRNSAVEAAIRCWRAGARVTVAARSATLDQARLISRLALEVDLLIRNGQVRFEGSVEPREISGESVRFAGIGAREGEVVRIDADFVYLATGFQMDQTLYHALGVTTEGVEARPVHNAATMETNVPGVYVVGTAIGGNQRGYRVFITTSHDHCLRAARAILPGGDIREEWVGNLAARDYPLSSRDVE